MTIHCFNGTTIRPYWPRIKGGVTCLLVDTNQGPVLVDTGFGLLDYRQPTPMVNLFMSLLRVPRDPTETARHQVGQYGYEPEDVKHIIMTHLHLDHAGGLPDFPHAQVHLYQPEFELTQWRRTGWEFVDYHWSHSPEWRPHQLGGEFWFDFEAVRLKIFEPEIWLVPLVGHSPGHSGVAVKTRDGWLLHASDAVPFNLAFDEVPVWLVNWLLGPHSARLRRLAMSHPEVQIIGAHMDADFYREWTPIETI